MLEEVQPSPGLDLWEIGDFGGSAQLRLVMLSCCGLGARPVGMISGMVYEYRTSTCCRTFFLAFRKNCTGILLLIFLNQYENCQIPSVSFTD